MGLKKDFRITTQYKVLTPQITSQISKVILLMSRIKRIGNKRSGDLEVKIIVLALIKR